MLLLHRPRKAATPKSGESITSWSNWYCAELASHLRPRQDGYVYACPCCGYPGLGEPGGFDICSICYWEDDGKDSHNADIVLGGSYGDYTLRKL